MTTTDAPAYPVGMMYGNHTEAATVRLRVYAVAGPAQCYRCGPEDVPQELWLEDLPPDPPCGRLIGGPVLARWFGHVRPGPATERMATALAAAGIPVTVWDGIEAVPYADWLARFPAEVKEMANAGD